jgi:CoA:oxalate CoA-transferase
MVERPRALEDVRVLDFSHILAGPYCTRQLADLGAEVIKIEPPIIGELSRFVGLHYWWYCNCGKKSLSLDLKQPRAIGIVRELAKLCDVVVESFKPGTMARLGIDYAALREINPGIIMCSITGFGQYGPYSHLPATAPVAHSVSGLEWLIGITVDPDGPPQAPGFALGDTVGAVHAVAAICGALYYREKTGVGQHIDIALVDCLFGINDRVQQHILAGTHQMASVSTSMIYPGRDGYLTVQCASQQMLNALARVMGNPDLFTDVTLQLDTPERRSQHLNLLNHMIGEWLQGFESVLDVLPILQEAGVICAPILSIEEAMNDPQLLARQMLSEIDDPERGRIKIVNTPFRFSDTEAGLKGSLPRLGEHNKEVLTSILGYSNKEIARLREDGVIYSDLRGYSLEEILKLEQEAAEEE